MMLKLENAPPSTFLLLDYDSHIKNGTKINFKYDAYNKVITVSEKRRIYSSSQYDYIMIEILNSDDIKDYFVFDENFTYKNSLYKEVICLNYKKIKFFKNSITKLKKIIITFEKEYYVKKKIIIFFLTLNQS